MSSSANAAGPDVAGYHQLSLDEQLAIARNGTAYFVQHLARVSDDDLAGSSLLPDWSRKHLVAHVGYNAAALCNLMTWAATGCETPMYSSPAQRNEEIDEGSTLGAQALRNLVDHTAARLDEAWRNLPTEKWDAQVKTIQGRTVPATETAWMRTREVWIHTIDLGAGGSFADLPEAVLIDLFDDIVGAWGRKGSGADLRLITPVGITDVDRHFTGDRIEVRGKLSAVVGWMTGRTVDCVQTSTEVTAPHWL
ncbi:maleylpyruvate isomerase family mycothiol-dependent enzyme [Gordonia otitidis]|uniref:maleylpyruvate isomerase family mycothiol-dependent enzyme n=1 Tax=Gordonia otitidis TaxID=249058 RepID=UPI001D136341|nr:maleylpyruvate isomerase family mycothiol-dependent enzyme [Gordonia otitidis]UEA57586.1 maleylpyruvate isomerase family mycothiol-dependent enzyme [Gordonia otitidis]